MRTIIRRSLAATMGVVAAATMGVVAGAATAGALVAAEPAPTTDEALERAAFSDWRARRDARSMPDGSTLTRRATPDRVRAAYAGETPARDGRDAALRIEFVPRFGCAPGIDVVLGAGLARQLAPVGSAEGSSNGSSGGSPDGLIDDDEATFLVDGTPVGYPVLRDERDGRVELAFNGNERERITLRLQLDVGDVVALGLRGDAEPLTFSLLGSRRTLAAAESLCLTHEPVEPGGANVDADD